ncbi:Ferritin light chain [Myotis davidii]|uniref:Ferritin light chain n=1 Tax=Myotis davidii TaxID=225400 RepID=L5LGY1_MYODS|nr:Ferritin light chain [Myotis davidii]
MEATRALERNLNQALVDLRALASACTNPHLYSFLENHFQDGQVKLIKRWATPDSPPQAAGPQAGLGEFLFERLPRKHV